MRELVAVPAVGVGFVEALRRHWDDGDAVLPVDPRLPPPAVAELFEAMEPTLVVDPGSPAPEGSARDGSAPGGSTTTSRRSTGRPVEDGDALVVPTSGSTGTPKGVVLTHDGLRASARAVNAALEVTSSDSWLCCLPLSHVAGLGVVLRAQEAGIPLEVHERFDARAVEDAARRGATLTALVPTALSRMDVSGYRRVIVGGAAPPADRPANVVASYAMTETGSTVALDGVALPGVDLRVVDGEVQVRGPMLLRAYRDGTDPRTADGWLPTGDEGSIGPDGRLSVFGRRGDMIVTGGENVWPAAVEARLGAHPEVASVAVVGRPDPEWGQVVTAIVVPSDLSSPPSLDSLRDHVRQVLPAFAAPKRLELVDALPTTPLGKIRRSGL